MKKIVALSRVSADFDYERQVFSGIEDVEFTLSPATEKAEVIKVLQDADVLLFADVTIDRDVIDGLKKCKLIIRYGIGYDNVDADYAAKKGITVCNAPNYGVIDVAEHTLSLILACAKRLTYMSNCIRENNWNTGTMGQSERLAGKTIGFIGFGKIARCVCTRTNAFGMKALIYDPYVEQGVLEQYNAEAVSFDALLMTSDYITLHLPLNEQTKHTLTMDEFKKMKPSAVVINTGRGGLIREPDLIDALEQKIIGGAGLDVFEDETGKMDRRILENKKVTLTPHVAWNTAEAVISLHKEVTDNVVRFLGGEQPHSVVN